MLEFFFFKQKTAYEILTCDWSSDVCSSDLTILPSLALHLIVKHSNLYERGSTLATTVYFVEGKVLNYTKLHVRHHIMHVCKFIKAYMGDDF